MVRVGLRWRGGWRHGGSARARGGEGGVEDRMRCRTAAPEQGSRGPEAAGGERREGQKWRG